MKNIVCVKEVPDPQDIVLHNENIVFEEPELIMNPFDEYAVEEIISLRERFGCSSVSLTLGNDPSVKAIKTAVALGVDHATEILSKDSLDSSSSGEILAQMIKKMINTDEEKIGLVIVGRQSIDQVRGQVGCVISEELNFPYITNVVEIIELNETETKVKRKDDSGYQILRSPVPCVIQVSGGEINEPRMPKLKGLLKAKKFVPETIPAEELVHSLTPTSNVERSIQRIQVELPPPRKKGTILQGEPQEQVNELVRKLESVLTNKEGGE
jgi:electron transfer flavoprotein beta subunit